MISIGVVIPSEVGTCATLCDTVATVFTAGSVACEESRVSLAPAELSTFGIVTGEDEAVGEGDTSVVAATSVDEAEGTDTVVLSGTVELPAEVSVGVPDVSVEEAVLELDEVTLELKEVSPVLRLCADDCVSLDDALRLVGDVELEDAAEVV